MSQNTHDDLIYAEGHLEFVSKQDNNEDRRLRAAILLSAIRLLNRDRPGWKDLLLEKLHSRPHRTKVEHIFHVDRSFGNSVMDSYLHSLDSEF